MSPESKLLPPAALEAEAVVLSALVLAQDPSSAAFAETVAIVGDRTAFHQPDHAAIFDAIEACAARGTVDGFLVVQEMTKRGTFDEAGGYAKLEEIVRSAPSAANGPHYAAIVRDFHQRRQLITLAADIDAKARRHTRQDDPAGAIGQDAAVRLARIVASGQATDSERVGDVALRVVDGLSRGDVGSVKIGFRDFDEKTGGILYGEEVILAARPSMGKSAIAKQIAWQVAAAGTPVAIISQEEGKAKIVRNMISLIGQVDNHRLRKPATLTPHDWTEINGATAKLNGVDLFVNDKARTLRDVRAAAASLVARHGVKLIIVDYLQRINCPGESRYEQVTALSQGVSDMVKELNVAGLILAQLSRATANREDKRPTMTDLRESGQIEQDADGVVFLHREDYYHLEDPNYQPTGVAELIVAKWRDGLRNVVFRLKSDLRHQGFIDGPNEPHDPFASEIP